MQLLALVCQCQYSNSWPIALHASLSFARNIISLNHMNNVNRARVAPLMLSHYRFPLERISEVKEHPHHLILTFGRRLLVAMEYGN